MFKFLEDFFSQKKEKELLELKQTLKLKNETIELLKEDNFQKEKYDINVLINSETDIRKWIFSYVLSLMQQFLDKEKVSHEEAVYFTDSLRALSLMRRDYKLFCDNHKESRKEQSK